MKKVLTIFCWKNVILKESANLLLASLECQGQPRLDPRIPRATALYEGSTLLDAVSVFLTSSIAISVGGGKIDQEVLGLTCIPHTRPTAEAHNAEDIAEKLILVLNVTLLRLRAKINF